MKLSAPYQTEGFPDEYITAGKKLPRIKELCQDEVDKYKLKLNQCADYLILDDQWNALLPCVNTIKKLHPPIVTSNSDYPFNTHELKALWIEKCFEKNRTTFNLASILNGFSFFGETIDERNIENKRILLETLVYSRNADLLNVIATHLETQNINWIEEKFGDDKTLLQKAAARSNNALNNLIIRHQNTIELRLAACDGKLDVVTRLLTGDNKPNLADISIALKIALENSQFEIAAYLCEAVAHLCSLADVNKLNKDVVSPLLRVAAYQRKWGLVKQLCALTGDNKPEKTTIINALYIAPKNEKWEIVTTLCNLTNINKLDKDVVDFILKQALTYHQWGVVRQLCALTSDNRPAQAAVSIALNEAMENNQWEVVITLYNLTSDSKLYHSNPLIITEMISTLKKNGILDKANLDVITNHANPQAVADIIADLKEKNILLTQANFTVITNHTNTISTLQKVSILTQANLNAIKNHTKQTVADMIFALERSSITLTQANFSVITNHTLTIPTLQKAGILTQPNLDMIARHADDPRYVGTALSFLQSANILTQANFNVVINHDTERDQPVIMFGTLRDASILTQDNFDAVMKHTRSPHAAANALYYLQRASILTPGNRDAIIKHTIPYDTERALCYLQRANILTQANFNAVMEHTDLIEIVGAYIFSYLQEANILTSDRFNAVMKHTNPQAIAGAISGLKRANTLTPGNFNAIKDHADLQIIAKMLPALQKVRILTQDNFNVVINHADSMAIVNALLTLQGSGILTPENRDAVNSHADPMVAAYALSNINSRRKNNNSQRFFAKQPVYSIAVEWVKTIYEKHGGGYFAINSILKNVKTYEEVVDNLQERLNSKEQTSGATYETLKEIGRRVPPACRCFFTSAPKKTTQGSSPEAQERPRAYAIFDGAHAPVPPLALEAVYPQDPGIKRSR